MGKVSLYGSFAILFIALMMMFVTGTGIKGTLYGMLILALIIGIPMILFRLLPEIVAETIVLSVFIIGSFMVFQSWMLTIILAVIMAIRIAFHLLGVQGRWVSIARVSFTVVMMIGGIWSELYMPVIDEQAQDAVIDELMAEDGVKKLSFDLSNDQRVQCMLVVEDDMSDAERQELGEACAKSLSDKVKPKKRFAGASDEAIGLLYDYYGLEVRVFSKGNSQSYLATKHRSDAGVTWYRESY